MSAPGVAAPASGVLAKGVPVWDPLLRLLHWTTMAAVITAYIAEEGEQLHDRAGYVVAVTVSIRILWGFIGPQHARFSDFVRGPRAVFACLLGLLRGRPTQTLGHTPAGGAMTVALLGLLTVIAGTGVMMSTEAFWGNKLVEEVHEAAANILMILIPLHVAAVIATSLLTGDNLVRAMIDGRKQRGVTATKV